ncbi:hypothetical protein DF107_29375 [Burkholderia stagnalis]|uniref:GlsB/YeaQ/YmgE family stress response membrane protein n=1 Tax=Burkholderia stagnalis TaxID=1503054 RepID=A0A104U9W3_9BURK|nr:hypothetical protein [Burkholderia stagnalis]MBN3819550.1 hypothetical protein [Paraburkholderia sp. Se-20369]MXN78954.1 hypothetical protein [Burkholderia sp. 4701]MXN83348.1 hypothetical protein [Burkholderia sp. 4812]RQR53291.1 hypothetical protein DIE18_30240 [Burkholderia sp. Bp9125]RQS04858.1 hypothetical protein DIE07_28125 [Burkholderia sp. Bp9002]TCW76875.1 hypothetical protein C5O80_35430 [Burkholderia sp. SRS-46]
MNWFGIVVLGTAVGLLGRGLHPLRRAGRPAWWVAVLVGIAGAAAAKMAGNLSGLFYDGETLEWPVCTGVAFLAVAVTVALAARR